MIGGGTPLARMQAMHARRKAQAVAKHKRDERRKRRVARNDANSEGVHTPAVLFQTPHTEGPPTYSDTLPSPDAQRQMSRASKERTWQDAEDFKSLEIPPRPSNPPPKASAHELNKL